MSRGKKDGWSEKKRWEAREERKFGGEVGILYIVYIYYIYKEKEDRGKEKIGTEEYKNKNPSGQRPEGISIDLLNNPI